MGHADFITNADDPIVTFEEDMLKRGPFVDRLAAVLKSAPSSSSNVFALFGEWGSGKTSVKNLVIRRFRDQPDNSTPIVVEFNPWAFSTQAELFESFFSEVSRALGRRDAGDVAAALSRMGTYLSIGAKTARALQVAADIAMLPGGSLVGMVADSCEKGAEQAGAQAEYLKTGEVDDLEVLRGELHFAIKKLGRSILIVIDDLDRLPPAQVLQMFQVVRVNAALPRINFLLLIDRRSILRSLRLAGQAPDYLEKIVQFALDLPHVAAGGLRDFARAGLTSIADELGVKIDWRRWEEGYVEACQVILDTPRKIRRLLHTFRFHLTIFCQDGVPEVDVVDLFQLEVIRLYAPDLWLQLPRLGDLAFGHGSIEWHLERMQRSKSGFNDELAEVVKLAPSEIQSACSRLVKLLLPQLDGGDKEHLTAALSTCRMCTETHFASYFVLTTNAGYPTQKEGIALLGVLNDPDVFTNAARELMKRYGFSHLLTKLHALQRDCEDPAAIAAMIATVWKLDEEDAGVDPVEGDWGRGNTEEFTLFFLRKLPDEETRIAVATEAFTRSRCPAPLFQLTGNDIERRKQNRYVADCAFSEDNALALQQLALKRVHELRESDKLIFHPNLSHLLWLWRQHEGAEAPKEWLKQQSTEGWRLGTILKAFFGRSTSGDDVRYFIPRKSLEQWFSLDEDFRTSLKATDGDKLDRWPAHAIREALRIFDHKDNDIQEAEFSE